MVKLELYGTKHCPHTQEMREWLAWKGTGFSEFDVDSDLSAFRRVQALLQPPYAVPLFVEDGKVVQVGWH
jgi:glutaredoxin 3